MYRCDVLLIQCGTGLRLRFVLGNFLCFWGVLRCGVLGCSLLMLLRELPRSWVTKGQISTFMSLSYITKKSIRNAFFSVEMVFSHFFSFLFFLSTFMLVVTLIGVALLFRMAVFNVAM